MDPEKLLRHHPPPPQASMEHTLRTAGLGARVILSESHCMVAGEMGGQGRGELYIKFSLETLTLYSQGKNGEMEAQGDLFQVTQLDCGRARIHFQVSRLTQ